jgi:hypothetical protein
MYYPANGEENGGDCESERHDRDAHGNTELTLLAPVRHLAAFQDVLQLQRGGLNLLVESFGLPEFSIVEIVTKEKTILIVSVVLPVHGTAAGARCGGRSSRGRR